MDIRLLLFPFLSFLFSSCITPFRVADILAYKYESKDDYTDFEIIGDEIIVKALLNEDSVEFLFDTGVNVEYLFLNKDFEQQGAKIKSIITPGGKQQLFTKKAIVNIETPSFSISNALGLEMPIIEDFRCVQNFDRANVLGLGAFLNGNKRYLNLDFENQKIGSSSSSFEIDEDYFILDFEKKNNMLFVFLTLNGQKQKFLFDTGNNAFVFLDKKENSLSSIQPQLIKEGRQIATVENNVRDTIEYFNNVKFEEFKNIAGDYLIFSSSSFGVNNIGLGIIESFN